MNIILMVDYLCNNPAMNVYLHEKCLENEIFCFINDKRFQLIYLIIILKILKMK